MCPQTHVSQKLITKTSKNHFRRSFTLASIFALTVVISVAYATSTAPKNAEILNPKIIKYIDSLPANSQNIPAWLVAELIPLSNQLQQSSQLQLISAKVHLNELLAEPSRYKSKAILINGRFILAVEVSKELELLPPDHCWSVILLDLDYLQPIQLFTSQNPSKFEKNSLVQALGAFLTNRIDRTKGLLTSRPVTIPVLVGTLKSQAGGKSFTKSAPSTKTNIIILGGIAILVAVFIRLKISLSRSSKSAKLSQLNSYQGRTDGKGTT